MKKLFTILGLTIVLFACKTTTWETTVSPDPKDASRQRLLDLIRSEMATKNIPGLSVSVVDSQGVLWSRGFGEAQKGKSAFTPHTISNVGSISKTITAAAILKLVDQGLVQLDSPLHTYLPDFKPGTRGTKLEDITIRRLLTHESGLSGATMYHFLSGETKPDNYPDTLSEVLDQVNQETVPRAPDQVFAYSNMGFALLGLVVEKVSGLKFNDFVTKEIFTPLGMKDSSFLVQEDKTDRYARGYLNGKELFVPYIRDLSAGSLCSTSDDMGLFLSSLLGAGKNDQGLLSQTLVKQMFTVQNKNVPLDLDFKVGLTWWIVDFQSMPGEFALGHGGDLPPYHALAALLPDRDLGVFIMVNGVDGVGSFSLTEILTQALNTFALEKGQKPLSEPRLVGMKSPIIPLPPEIADKMVGYYATPAGLCQVKKSGTDLQVFAFGNWFDLTYHSDKSFTLGMKILGLFPLNLPIFQEIYASAELLEGKSLFNLRIKGLLLAPGVEIKPSPPLPSWINRSGYYHQTNSEISPMYQEFRLDQDPESGFYCLSLKSEGQWTKFPLRTLSNDQAVLEGQGRGLGETVQVLQDSAGEVLHFSGLILRKN